MEENQKNNLHLIGFGISKLRKTSCFLRTFSFGRLFFIKSGCAYPHRMTLVPALPPSQPQCDSSKLIICLHLFNLEFSVSALSVYEPERALAALFLFTVCNFCSRSLNSKTNKERGQNKQEFAGVFFSQTHPCAHTHSCVADRSSRLGQI